MATYGIGAVLRAERIRQALSVEEVARKTKISARFLAAIEDEDFDALPGLVFARGFIRQYANLLNLDTDGLLGRMPKPDTAAMPMPDAAQHERARVVFSQQQPTSSLTWDPRWNSAIASFLWIGLGVAAAVGAYVYFNKSNTPPVTSRAVATAEPAASKPVVSPAKETEPAATPVVAPAENQIPPAPGKPVQLTLTASEPAWVSVTADDKNVYTGTLQADDKKNIEADTLIKLVAGNAGGLKVSLNGKDLEPLGPKGQVRVVRFTAEGPQFSARTPGAPPNDPL